MIISKTKERKITKEGVWCRLVKVRVNWLKIEKYIDDDNTGRRHRESDSNSNKGGGLSSQQGI